MLGDIEAARDRIAPHIRRTPLEYSAALSARAGADVYLKLECWQRTGSFKVRGAFNAVAVLPAADRARGLVTASAGNHGLAVALAAATSGAQATVFVPHTAPEAKKAKIRRLGAILDDSRADYDEAEDEALRFAADRGAAFIHAFSDPAVVAGQGTVGIEIVEDLPAVRSVLVPVGGGGLIAGIGAALRDRGISVIGAQSERTRNLHAALAAGRIVDCPFAPTLADGLAGRTDEASLRRVRTWSDGVHLVDEPAIRQAIRDLFTDEGVVAEGAGAVAVAALSTLELALEPPIVLVISGRNLDGGTLAGIISGSG